MHSKRAELLLGVGLAVFAVLALVFWIPNDIESGIIEKIRRREKMGDALFPTAIAMAIAVVAAAHALIAALAARRSRHASDDAQHAMDGLRFLVPLLVIIAISFALIELTGPSLVAAINAFGADIGSYRELRDTAPYKYVGFALGGFVLVFALIALIEGRARWRGALIAIAAVIAIVALYDLPFEDLLLPPNGDQ